MADTGVKLNIETTAQLDGIKNLQVELKGLEERGRTAQDALKELGLVFTGSGFDRMKTEATGASAAVKEVGESAIFAGGSMAKFRAEAVTLVREMAAGGNTTRTLGAMISALNPIVAAAGVGAFVLAREIFSLSKEIETGAKEVLKLAQANHELEISWLTSAEGAKTFTQAANIGLQALRSLTEEAKKVAELQQQAAHPGIVTTLLEGAGRVGGLVPGVGPTAHPITDELKANAEAARVHAQMEQLAAVAMEKEAEFAATEYEARLKTMPVVDAINKTLQDIVRISEQRAKYDPTADNQQYEAWVRANKQIGELTDLLGLLMDKAKKVQDEFIRTGEVIEREMKRGTDAIDKANKKEIEDFLTREKAVADTTDEINVLNAAGDREAVIQEKVAQAYNKKLESLRAAHVPEEQAIQLARDYATATQHNLEVQDQSREKTDELSAAMHRLQAAMQAIQQQATLIKESPFLGADEKQAMTLQNIAQEMKNIQQQEIELRRQAAGGALDDAQLARVNQQLQQADFRLKGLSLEFQKLTQPLQAELQTWADSFGTTIHQIAHTIESTINTSLEALNQYLVTGKFNAQQLEQQIVLLGLRLVEQLLIQKAVSLINQQQAAASAQSLAAVVGAAWAAPATAVTTATEGQAAYSAPAAFGVALAAIQAMMGLGSAMSAGGHVGGTGTSDSVPAVLAPGEFVINRESASAIGYDNLYMLNAYARGGMVTPGRSFYQEAVDPELPFGGFPPTDYPATSPPPADTTPTTSPPDTIPDLPGVTANEPPPVDLPGVTVYGPPGGFPGIPILYGGGRGGRGGTGAIFHSIWSGRHPMSLAAFNRNLAFIRYQGPLVAGAHPFGGYNYRGYLSLWHSLRNAKLTAPATFGGTHGIGNIGVGGGHRTAFQKGGLVGGGGVHIYAFTDLKELTKHMASREGQKIIFDTVKGQRINLGI